MLYLGIIAVVYNVVYRMYWTALSLFLGRASEVITGCKFDSSHMVYISDMGRFAISVPIAKLLRCSRYRPTMLCAHFPRLLMNL